MKYGSKAGFLCGLFFLLLAGWSSLPLEGQVQPQPQQQRTELIKTAEDAIGQISDALSSVLFAWSSARLGDFSSAKTHAHQALNIIEGRDGPNYDASYGTPEEGVGDGTGALNHVTEMLSILRVMDLDPQSPDHVIAAENAIVFLQAAVTHLTRALDKINSSRPQQDAVALELRETQAMLMAARASQEEKDRPTEGGVRSIWAWVKGIN